MMHICMQVKDNCWNFEDSYGEICVHCGCCSKDPLTRAKARLKTSLEHLEDRKNFNGWLDDPKWKAKQEENVKADIKYFKKRINYYRRRVDELSGMDKRNGEATR